MRPTQGAAQAGETFGPYQLVKQLAVGGMAEIYLARATGISGFEKFVALKIIHPNYAEDTHFIDMLVEEAKIVVHLTQPNIVQIFDLGRIGDVHYIAMEFVDGLDLYQVLRAITEAGDLLDFDVVAFVCLEICAALDYAHRCHDQLGRHLGIIHRDISPQNILVSRAGEVKLADFGIAKATVRARQTAVGVIKGKYYYMSPEQAWGDVVDHRTDIFSTGVVLYESLVGQMLYLEEDIGVLLEKVRKAEIPPPTSLRPDIPPALEEIVLRAVARRPEDRFQTAHDFQVALQRFLWSYAPNFNLSRVRDLMRRAVSLLEAKRPFDPGDPSLSAETARASQKAPKNAALRLHFSSHSLLPAEVVRTGEAKLASLPDWGDDCDEATTISAPPLMLAHLHPEATGAPAPPPILPISFDMVEISGTGAPRVSWDEVDGPTAVHRKGGSTPSASPPRMRSPIPSRPPPPLQAQGSPLARPAVPGPQPATPSAAAPRPTSAAPPPVYFRGAVGQVALGAQADTEGVDELELALARGRRQRNLILLAIAVCLVLVLIAGLILYARRALQAPGSVIVESHPPGARVHYKGRFVGLTPQRLDSLTIDDEHSVRLDHDRCASTRARLPVEAGKVRRVVVKMEHCDN